MGRMDDKVGRKGKESPNGVTVMLTGTLKLSGSKLIDYFGSRCMPLFPSPPL